MESNQLNSPAFDKGQNKGKAHSNQLQTIFQYLRQLIATTSVVSKETGVRQKNICRYKRNLENNGNLCKIIKDVCLESGFKAWYLTTDQSKAPKCAAQLKLFSYE